MRFPVKKNAGCPKAPRDFPPRKDGILQPPSGCLATSLPLPQSLYGRTDGRTLMSQPKFLGLIDYQISLAMVLHWRASVRAPLWMETTLRCKLVEKVNFATLLKNGYFDFKAPWKHIPWPTVNNAVSRIKITRITILSYSAKKATAGNGG